MNPDRERIEREARNLVRDYSEDTFPSRGELQDAIVSLVLRERAAALEMAAEKLEAARLAYVKDNPTATIHGAMWSQSLFVAEESVRALAAQERAS